MARQNQKSVYVFDMGNGTVKIGVSKNIEQRRQAVMGNSGLQIIQYCYSHKLPIKKAFEIESACHQHFANEHVFREFFAVSYFKAKTYLATHVNIVGESHDFPQSFSVNKRGEKIWHDRF